MNIRHFSLFAILLAWSADGVAQSRTEPDLLPTDSARSPLDEGMRSGMAFNLSLNNFGFAIGTEYRRLIGRDTEIVLEAQWSGLRDVSEQNFQYYTGQQVIPNKFQRVMAFPVLLGMRQRLFADAVSDNFRIYLSGQVGPTFAYAYPYFQPATAPYYHADDPDFTVVTGPIRAKFSDQFANDIFQGWGKGSWVGGTAGQFTIGADFGAGFKSIQSLKIGVLTHVYPSGIQILEPIRLRAYDEIREAFVVTDGSPKQRVFVSPVITLVLGGMW
jgi:hypothetical protein